MGGVEDSSSVKKIDEMSRIVKEKMEEKVRMESLCRTLIAEERKSHDELQEARKEFISGLKERLSGRSLKQLVFDSALVGGEEDSSVMEKIEEMSGELKQKMDASEHSSASFRRICNAVISELEEKLCVWSFKVLIFRSAVLFKGGGEASSLLKEIDEMGSHLKDMMEEVERLNCLNVDSIAKFRKGIDELWKARLDVISDWGVGDQNVGLENRRCRIVCKCAELFSFWEGLLANL